MTDPDRAKTGSTRSIQTVGIDVCVCTFRRQSLDETLASLKRQSGLDFPIRIVVADNDDTMSGRAQVERYQQQGLDILYVHAPARNISIARNACLDHATAPLIAFIDDDEIAADDWLSSLLMAINAAPDTAAVFGPVIAVYPPDAPAWVSQADLHSTRPVATRGGINTGYTSNALVRRSAVGEQRFDLALGRCGGEDTDFFTRLHQDGAVFAAAAEAVVSERVAPGRLSLGWLSMRAFRSGQTHARRFLGSPQHRFTGLGIAAAKTLVCFCLTIAGLGSRARWRRAWVRTALHAGASSRLLGIREPTIYG